MGCLPKHVYSNLSGKGSVQVKIPGTMGLFSVQRRWHAVVPLLPLLAFSFYSIQSFGHATFDYCTKNIGHGLRGVSIGPVM